MGRLRAKAVVINLGCTEKEKKKKSPVVFHWERGGRGGGKEWWDFDINSWAVTQT